ncbi:MAG TPA: hypothetical protein DCR14_06725 [Acidimicrobiaceae bacterium]|nr:hypothetical protein [Acidimicrobiaceae bacterium]
MEQRKINWWRPVATEGPLYAGKVVITGALLAVAAIAAGIIGGVPGNTHMPDRATAIDVGIKIAGGFGVLTAGLLAWEKLRQSHMQHTLAERTHLESLAQTRRSHLDERFNTAVEQLGHQAEAVRLGALYALDALLRNRDNDNDERQRIVNVVCAYVRSRSAALLSQGGPVEPLPTDYQAAAHIALHAPETCILDLSGAVLHNHHLEYRVFTECRFVGTRFTRCYFTDSTFTECDLAGALYSGVQFIGVTFARCELVTFELDHDTNQVDVFEPTWDHESVYFDRVTIVGSQLGKRSHNAVALSLTADSVVEWVDECGSPIDRAALASWTEEAF